MAEQSAREVWAFWHDAAAAYARASPHRGYERAQSMMALKEDRPELYRLRLGGYWRTAAPTQH